MHVYAETIKENVSAQDVGLAMGLKIMRGRCQCPIHGGHDFNCRLYPGDRGFVCHVCKVGGDVIKLYRASNPDVSFPDTVRWFNDTFGLGMDVDSPVDQKRLESAKKRLKRKADQRMDQEHFREMMFDMYLTSMDALRRFEDIRDENRPRRYGDEWNKAFADAVQAVPEINRYIDYFESQCLVVKK